MFLYRPAKLAKASALTCVVLSDFSTVVHPGHVHDVFGVSIFNVVL